MQEEIEHKTVNFAISTTKLSARALLRGMQFLLRQYDKHASQGKQSMKRLVRQNRGVTNVEIQKTGIKDFDRYAKRYHIDYAIQKDLSCTPPRYMIYFKSQDTDALSAAFKEYSASVLDILPCFLRRSRCTVPGCCPTAATVCCAGARIPMCTCTAAVWGPVTVTPTCSIWMQALPVRMF